MSDFVLPQARTAPRSASPFRRAFGVQLQVIYALILHDIKNRFFGNGLGYVVMIIWPAVHMVVIMGIFLAVGRPVPYGHSAALYAATGVLPYIAWNYISRFMSLGMLTNKTFRGYPVVKPLDMMFSRMVLEIVSIYFVTVGTIAILALCQVDVMPLDPGQAMLGLLSAVALGVGCGYLVATFTMLHYFFSVFYVIFLIIFWVASGLAIDPEALPEQVGQWLALNPLLHSIEWVRSAYYADFPAHLLDKAYVLKCAGVTLVLGLVMEKILQRVTLK